MSRALAALVTEDADRSLIARLKQRDEKAIAQLSRRFSAVLYSLVLNIVGDAGLAEDLLAEIFIKALNLTRTFPDTDVALGLWMLRLARNHAVDSVRHKDPEAQAEQRASSLESPGIFVNSAFAPSDLPALERMRTVFLNASENDRLALELAWYEGLTFAQIAGKLGQSTEAVRLSLEDSLEALRTASRVGEHAPADDRPVLSERFREPPAAP